MSASPAPNRLPASSFKIVAHERVADKIVAELRSRIASGELAPASKLPTERELAKVFGVSPPTIREAVRALSSTGLVEVRQGSGTYVAADLTGILDGSLAMLVQLEQVSLAEMIDLMRVLSEHAAELALNRATDEDLAALRAAAESSAQCRTRGEADEAVTRFVLMLVALAHQPLLDALCGFVIRMVVRIESASYGERSVAFWRRWARDTVPLRLKIVEALEARDAQQLTDCVARYHTHIRDRILRVPALRDARLSDPMLVPLLAAPNV